MTTRDWMDPARREVAQRIKTLTTPELTVRAQGGLPAIDLTTDDVDAMGDRTMQTGLTFRNPLPILFAHQYHELPVGQATAAMIHRDPHRTRISWRWLEGDARAATVKNAFEQGFLGASIGMRVQETVPNAYGGVDILRAKGIEGSLTATPANPACVRLLKDLGWRLGVTARDQSCPAGRDCPNLVAQAEQCPAGKLCPAQSTARTSWDGGDERIVRVVDDRAPVWQVDAAEFAAAWQLAVADVVTATYNRLKGRVD
jgi:hypothetical protein